MVPAERPDIRLILKSGNFGQEDFFRTRFNKNFKVNGGNHGSDFRKEIRRRRMDGTQSV